MRCNSASARAGARVRHALEPRMEKHRLGGEQDDREQAPQENHGVEPPVSPGKECRPQRKAIDEIKAACSGKKQCNACVPREAALDLPKHGEARRGICRAPAASIRSMGIEDSHHVVRNLTASVLALAAVACLGRR